MTDSRDTVYTIIDRLDAVRDLVVAVDRYVEHQAEADQAVRQSLWQAMTTANTTVAELFKVYPL